MAGISFELDTTEVLDAVKQLLAKTGDMQPAFDEVGIGWRTLADLCFREESDPWGSPWEPLTETTLSRRRGTSAKILRDTGVLANSITYDAAKDSLVIGTAVEYAAAQFLGMKKGYAGSMSNGSPIPWGDIPPRPALPIRPNGEIDLPDAWRRHLMDTINRYLSL